MEAMIEAKPAGINNNDAEQAYAEARVCFERLRRTSVSDRMAELALVRLRLLEQTDWIIESLMVETGKTRTDASIEVIGTLDWLKWLEDNGARLLQDEKVTTPITLMGKQSKIKHEALGVVLIIAPWNYPLHIGITQIFTAFVCGNTVVYKPSEVTPMKGVYEKVLAASTLLSDSVSIVYGNGETGRQLIVQKPEKIFFTGSTRTGKAIMAQAANHLIPVDLELGGKDPMIVFDSANIKRAVAGAVWGAFTHNGQSCSAVERLYVQEGIYDQFVAELKAETQQLVQCLEDDGDADLGAMTVDFQLDIVESHVEDAVQKGAQVICGGQVIDRDKRLYAPTVLADVNQSMMAVSEETFGPLLPVIKFNTEEEVITLANDSRYGLCASVFTKDLEQGERVAECLEVGGVSINNVNMTEGNPWLSFGGRKESGCGRARGVEGLLAFTRSKAILIDSDSSKIEANWYPYTTKKHLRIRQFIRALYDGKPMRLLRVAVSGLRLEAQSQKPR